MIKRHPIISFYVVMLGLSWITIRFGSSPPSSTARSLQVDNQIVRYQILNEGAKKIPVLFIHGSPGDRSQFKQIAPAVCGDRPVITLDLPGFGESRPLNVDQNFTDYAVFINQFLNQLQIESVDLAAFSMGGGIAITMAYSFPEMVRSVSLFSAIGVQEHELTGDYLLNHSIHGLQLTVAHTIYYLFPHFGALGLDMFVNYSEQFFVSDQRPLAEKLGRLSQPVLIFHGTEDILVPYSAAEEHHRIAKNSRLVSTDYNHFYLFNQNYTEAKDELCRFLSEIEADTFVPEISSKSVPVSYKPSGFSVLIIAILIALATLVSEDLAAFSAGILAAKGTIALWVAVLAAFIGIVVGDILLYLLGRSLGAPLIERAPFKWMINSKQINRTRAWFAREGFKVILISRFTPGTRFATYVSSGIFRTPFLTFAGYFVLACLLWVPLLVSLSYLFGNAVYDYFGLFEQNALWILVGAIAFLFAINTLLVPMFTHRGRRLLYAKVIRWRNWEFWPVWFFNLPVVLNYFRLSLKYRSLKAFTAVNPAIPDGGFIGESKFDILQSIGMNEHVARYDIILHQWSFKQKIEHAERFLEKHRLSYPIVLKPDQGQRGEGVKICKNSGDVASYLAHSKTHDIIQEYVPGVEFGIFYYRKPGQERGHIFSITRKLFSTVEGDGVRSLEQLIVDDDRAVIYADYLFQKHDEHLQNTPANGDQVILTDLGTHCRGARFERGFDIRTHELESFIDAVSRSFDGFYFGRFDVRGPNDEAFREAKNLKIIELNGATSEATHIYHPGSSLKDAYATLFQQWEIAFEIGKSNQAKGAKTTPFRILIFKWIKTLLQGPTPDPRPYTHK